MNTLLLKSGRQGLLIDAGIMFADQMVGVDFIAPDFAYLEEAGIELLGIVLTHGHEDHIGGLPYLLPQFPAPIYGSRLTLALLEGKLREHGLRESTELHPVKARDTIHLGPFEVEFIHVT